MFSTEPDWLSSSYTEPDEFHWHLVRRGLPWPWLIVQLAEHGMGEFSEVVLDDVDCLLHLCKTETLGTVLDVHMVIPPLWPQVGRMRMIHVTSLSSTRPSAQGGTEVGVLTTELGDLFVGQMMEPWAPSAPNLVPIQEFPDIEAMRDVYGAGIDDDSPI